MEYSYALAGIIRESDVLGLLDRGVLAAILTDIAPESVKVTEDRLDRELRIRVQQFERARMTLQVIDGESREFWTAGGQTLGGAVKRIFDIAGSLTLLLLLCPLLTTIGLAVRLSSKGPVLFRQARVGWRMVPFTMLKFRTMYAGSTSELHQRYVTQFIKAGEEVRTEGDSPMFKLTNDPRITPFGHFLRRTSLDELPQLWNVLRGDMSLVGPRPPLAYEMEQYKSWHQRRVLEAKPGITGLWQVVGRSRTTFDEMVRLDLRYARTRSLWTDVKILLATPRAVIMGKGAC